MNNIYIILLLLILILFISKEKKEKFSNENCIIKKELLSLIDPTKLGTYEEALEFTILEDSGIYDKNNDEIEKIKISIKKKGFKNTIDNYYICE